MVAEIERASQMNNEQLERAWREIGQRLQDTRTRLDEPFAVVAARAEIKPMDLAALERGEIRPTGKELQALLAALKLSHVDFVGDLSLESRLLIMELFDPKPEVPSLKSGDSERVKEHSSESVLVTSDVGPAQDALRPGVRPKRSSNGWGVAHEPGQITYYQMHACLRGLFKRTDREKAEIIYFWTSPSDIDVKIFTEVLIRHYQLQADELFL
jgi:transcriptional regulator with XRE-family HTH domain